MVWCLIQHMDNFTFTIHIYAWFQNPLHHHPCSYALPSGERSINPVCLHFPLAHEYLSWWWEVCVSRWWWSTHVQVLDASINFSVTLTGIQSFWFRIYYENIYNKILILILISISSKSWGAALCGYWGRMFDTADLDNRFKDGGKFVSLTRRPRFTPQEFFFH
jgi:hypothetical protein